MGVTMRGDIAAAGYEYTRATYGAEVWERILARLSPEDRACVESCGSETHMPVAVEGRVYEALVAEAFGGDLEVADRELREAGSLQAEALLARYVGVLAHFMTPRQAFKRAGGIVASTYHGATSSTEPSNDGHGGVIRVRGLGEVCYAAPWQCGWMEAALRFFGARRARVTERSWEAGRISADELVFDVSWG